MTTRFLGLFVGGPVRAVAWGTAILVAIGWLVSPWAVLALAAVCLGYAWWWARRLPRRWWLGS